MTTPFLQLRLSIFHATQTEMAAIAGVNQSQVSRWERGVRRPSLREMERIRAEALRRDLPWDDRWFFEVPEQAA
ncbi:helix-turn-helix domain-containing protein [Mesorhizobium sp. ES1-4]|uniref:helix-turn-helix domain-containing protein n=1 Tax=Mesorhizobium sp. ES1-4 TaxID=2876627 RepID=UPI001CD02BB8|nr:helix-turn-helix transcriptional regulator [Mesorhizobium sp. ES1-4]MBZ9794329.1 helix-turn-helix domain-containing protein [Mesorhizobium sp. ES1-4]